MTRPLKSPFITAMLAIAATALLGLTACNNDDDNTPSRTPLMAMVTLVSNTETTSTFNIPTGLGNTSFNLYADASIQGTVKPGDRMVLMFYAPGDTLPTRDAKITPVALQMAFTAGTKIANIADSTNWQNISTTLQSMWRTGNYLNIAVTQWNELSKTNFTLVADESSLSGSCAELYLINHTPESYTSSQYNAYASFDITPVISAGVSRFNVHLKNSGNPMASEMAFQLSGN